MQEDFLHYIWQYHLYDKLTTIENETVEVLTVGIPNQDSGPDFFNAKIKIADTLWVGNIEIHVASSDWKKHHHHTDKAYDNVILHLVYTYDQVITRSNGSIIPTAILRFDANLHQNYQYLLDNKKWIHCQDKISKVDSFFIQQWLDRLLIERLEQKATEIETRLTENQSNWEASFYQSLGKAFGFSVNSLPFEQLTKSLPLPYLGKHKNSLFQLEAMLFGQAGMLDDPENHPYTASLHKEYKILAAKFKLKPIEKHLWKFMRLRPANFPTIRIAQFALLIHQSVSLFSKIIESKSLNEVHDFFDTQLSGYWLTHYRFGKESVKRNKTFGQQAFESIVINTIVPFLFVYAKHKAKPELKDRAFSFLETLGAEKNSIIQNWAKLGITAQNAYESQALLQLKKRYCTGSHCL